MGVTHPSIVVIHEIKKPTEKEVSELMCYNQVHKQKNNNFCFEKLGSAIKQKADPGFDSCSNNLFWRRSRNHVKVRKCQVGTQQCKVRRSGFPLFFPLKLNTIPKELLSHKHLQPKKIEPCDVKRPSSWTNPTG